MKKRILIPAILFIAFFGILTVMTLFADNTAAKVRGSVLRFHIVANSDSASDQSNKFAVRDGIASLCNELFSGSKNKSESMQIAQQNLETIEKKAAEILAERGNFDTVKATVRKRFFPSRSYEGVNLPAGVYDTLDLTIGQAKGQNFWCVMFPGICLSGSGKIENKHKMSGVLDSESLQLVTDDSPQIVFKFRLVEIYQNLKNKILG